MTDSITLPVKKWDGGRWAEICAHAPTQTYYVVGERVDQAKDYSFAGGHRVRMFKFKKNVHFRVVEGTELDISEVRAAAAPRRQGGR